MALYEGWRNAPGSTATSKVTGQLCMEDMRGEKMTLSLGHTIGIAVALAPDVPVDQHYAVMTNFPSLLRCSSIDTLSSLYRADRGIRGHHLFHTLPYGALRELPQLIACMVSRDAPSFAAPADPRGAHVMVEEGVKDHINGQPHDRLSDLNLKAKSLSDGGSKDVEITLGQKMLSAVSGSVFTSLLVTPLDVVRVRLQSQQHNNPAPSRPPTSNGFTSAPLPKFSNLPANLGYTTCCREVFWVTNNTPYCVAGDSAVASLGEAAGTGGAADCAVEEAQKRRLNSTFDGLKKIARNEGVTTLWRGLSPTLVMAVPGNVIYFAGYDWLRTSQMSPIKGRIDEAYSPLVAGSTARVFAALFVSPVELFRTRMQASQSASAAGTFRDTLGGVKEMVQNQGIRTLWRGLTLTLWRDVPFSAFYWWGYEATRNLITDARERGRGRSVDGDGSWTRIRNDSRSRQNHATTLIDSFASGAISGGIASVVTTPFDVGKTRQQVYRQAGDSASQSAPGSGPSLAPQDRSMPRLLAHIYREEGIQGLFRGTTPRVLKVAPACAIMISTYELGKKWAQRVQEAKQE